jgi:predicted DCC family thiol-disulfide oxidoreductase YuxK
MTETDPAACLTVYHDGSCPLCRREIALARRVTENVSFVDVSSAGASEVAPGLTGDVAMQRFHVRRSDGAVLSGAAAFLEMWSSSPRLSWLQSWGRRRWLVSGLDLIYGQFLRVRPAISRFLQRFEH